MSEESRRPILEHLDQLRPGRYRTLDKAEGTASTAMILPNVRLANGEVRQETRQMLITAFKLPFYPEILIASPDGATSHNALFAATMSHESSKPVSALRMPKALCGPGMWARDLAGRVLGDRPFERPWMAEYIDTVMAIDASKTRARTGWAPRERLEILRRLPFLLENRRTYPLDWHRLNRAAMKTVHVPQNLRLYQLLERHQSELVDAYSKALVDAHLPSYEHVSPEDHEWHHKMILRQLMNAVRTQDRHVLVAYCGDLAGRRYRQGFKVEELCGAVSALDGVCTTVLARAPEAKALATEIHEDISTPLKWGVDRIQETYESLAAADARRARAAHAAEPVSVPGR